VPAAAGGAGASKDNFMSMIRSYRLSQNVTGSKHGEYEVTCKYRVASMRVQKDIVYQWSVWKRFSEFEVLHNSMKKSLGWQVDSIAFPSSYVFSMNKLSPEFLEQRRSVVFVLVDILLM
jgi:hypothetical protein